MIANLGKLKPIAAAAALAGVLCAACGGRQSAVDAAGIQASRLEDLWWLFLGVCTAVYVIVISVLLVSLIRSRKASSSTEPEIHPDAERERRVGNVVKTAVAITLIVMFTLMIVSFRTGRAVNSLTMSPDPISIKITGNQWWWNIEYIDVVPSNNIQTANELHLPAGRVVKLELQSTDVIHSFWLPNMHGKKDLIPNYPTTFYFRPDALGTYSGQCAEFCGYQHAKMRFTVIVETPEQFEAWATAARQIPPPPANAVEQKGQQVFLGSTCTQCHTIAGTNASGKVGPNLSHIASRPYIAAGSLPNNHENLRTWVTDAQSIKPGTHMPQNTFSKDDLEALVAYLESLK